MSFTYSSIMYLADFDFFLRGLTNYFTDLNFKQNVLDEVNGLKSKLQLNTFALSEKIIEQINLFTNYFIHLHKNRS
jgi:hypothetical protein